MQKYKIEISDLAEQDLEFAADYIAFDLKNPSAAINTVQGIRKQINKLQNFPERNPWFPIKNCAYILLQNWYFIRTFYFEKLINIVHLFYSNARDDCIIIYNPLLMP